MRVVIAPDSFKGTLTAPEAAAAIAEGWARCRHEDELVLLPMSDGGDGLLEVVATDGHVRHDVEVAGPLGHPTQAAFLLRGDGLAVVESAQACGLALVPADRRNPLHTATFGVGQLLDAARQAGALRILVGLGGSATVDGGSGALLGLGFRLRTGDGNGLKVGGGNLEAVAAADRGWAADWTDVEVRLLSDVRTRLDDAARVFGPQKGATPEAVAQLARGLERWADVVERDLTGGERLRDREGTGAAGGLGFGLAAGIGATLRPGAEEVGALLGLDEALEQADVVVVGEGELDDTSVEGKVVGAVLERARDHGVKVTAVVGVARARLAELQQVEEASPDGPGERPEVEVAAAAARLAEQIGRHS